MSIARTLFFNTLLLRRFFITLLADSLHSYAETEALAFIKEHIKLNISKQISLNEVIQEIKNTIINMKYSCGITNQVIPISVAFVDQQIDIYKKNQGYWRQYIRSQ